MQDVVAPIVLDNLNCTGTEPRLVDCPAPVEDDYNLFRPGFDYTYTYSYLVNSRSPGCDAVLGTYAVVACGTESGASAHPCD